MTLIMPSFVLGDYSLHPDKFMVDRYEMLYYFVSGVCFWLFHSQLTQILSQPEETLSRPELALYSLKIAVAGTIFLDYTWLGHYPDAKVLCGAFFLIAPSIVFDVYTYVSEKAY